MMRKGKVPIVSLYLKEKQMNPTYDISQPDRIYQLLLICLSNFENERVVDGDSS